MKTYFHILFYILFRSVEKMFILDVVTVQGYDVEKHISDADKQLEILY